MGSVHAASAVRSWRSRRRAIGLSACAAALVLLPAVGASALTFTVNSTADLVDANPGNGVCETGAGNGVCTLRAAIQEANALAGADTINLPAGVYLITRPAGDDSATNGDLDLNTDLSIVGAGARTTIVDGNGTDRVFDARNGTVAISGLTMRNGSINNDGGGIRNSTTLTLTDVTVSGNQAQNGGGVQSTGTLTLVRVLVSGNQATSGTGGGIQSNGGGPRNYLTNVTISGNSATGDGGGAELDHGELLNVTITANSTSGGAGSGLSKRGGQAHTVRNTIVAGNTGSTQCNGTPTSLGNNLSGDASCSFGVAGDLQNTNPLLGALADNGGPTDTHALLTGSPAIDTGTNTGAPATDQRGVARPLDGDGNGSAITDIGAFESTGLVISGRVFEDANFAGTAAGWDGGAADLGLANVDVELYDGGTNAYISSTNTAAGGTYSFTGLTNGSYRVRVRSATIGDADTPPRGGLNATVPGTWPYPLAEMTWANGAARYGGQSATVDDTVTGDNAGPGDTYVTLALGGSSVANVDFGFAYNLIVNADDDANVDGARSKQGGLRQFIKNANAIGSAGGTTASSSQFRMQVATNQASGGDSWWRIVPPVALPAIADGGTTLDGGTQRTNSGVDSNTLGPEIEVVGGGTLTGITITAANNAVRGLVLSGFAPAETYAGVVILGAGATGNTVAGNYIGTNATGTAAASPTNYQAISISSATGNTIGGTSPADRNVLSGNTWNGIRIRDAGAGSNTVVGNYIGTDATGTAAIPNQLGVYVWDVPGNVIGGTALGAGNVLSGNAQWGVYVFGANGTGNVIQGNTIGLTAGGGAPLPNGFAGVQFASSSNNLLGGTAASAGNVIASNGTRGVSVTGPTAAGNAFVSNSIRNNTGLGIDLNNDGVTPNDAGDVDTGPNGLLNFPVLISAVGSLGQVVGTFSLDVPAGSYRVEFFKNPSGADPSGYGEGQVFAGSTVVTHPGGGSRFFAFSFAGVVGDIVTATATFCTDGGVCAAFGSTSEFGNALTAVTTAVKLMSFEAVSGDGAVELRWRTGSELDNVGFHVYRGASAGGPWTRLTSSLIPGLGSSPLGQSYSWLDRGLSNGVTYYYRLEDVDTASVSTFHGPVWAVPEASAPPPGGGGGGGSGGTTGVECPSWVVASLGTVSSPVVCTKHGDPEAVSLDVVSRDVRGATLELRTGGFWAVHTLSGASTQSGASEGWGTVRVFVPGLDTPAEALAPALPLRRALVSAVVGKKVRLVSAEALDLRGFAGLRPSAVGVLEMAVGRDGTVRPGRRAVSAPGVSRGYLPRYVARLAGTVFQGESKSAVVEIVPVRFDGYRQQLVLAGRVRVRLGFTGLEAGETGTGSTGRVLRRKATPMRETLVQLHTSGRGVHAVSFEDVFPGRGRGMAVGQLRLQRQGEAVGFRVEPATGEFGPGSTLFFYADQTASSTDYTSEVAWELVRSSAGAGMGVVLGTPEGGAASSSSMGFATFETNRSYQPGLLEAQDVWLWESMVGGVERTESLTLSGVEPGSSSLAQVVIDLQGGSDSGTAGEHHVQVSLNGAVVGEGRFAGQKPYRLSLGVSASQLVEGANLLGVRNVGDTGVSSLVFLDKVGVGYPQAAAMRGGVFEGTWAEGGTVEVGGVVSSPVVLDVTVGGSAKWVSGFESASGSVRFRAEPGRRYVVVSREGWRRPRIAWPAPTTLRSGANRADYLLIAPREFLGAAEPLLARRESQGLATRAVSFEEIAEVFGHGRPSAEAIREFVSYAYHSWSRPSPRYVVLLGDATNDPRRFQATSWASPLPALWAKTSYLWTVSDPALVAVNGTDLLPDLAVGRLPATTLEEAEKLVWKLLSWEDSGQDLGGKAVLVADNPDPGGDFEADVEDVLGSYLTGRTTEVLKLRELGASTRGRVREAFDGGASLMSYVGHGGSAVWASENVWNSWDAPSLQAQSRQPLLLTMNCLNGYFVAPNFNSLSESVLKAQGRGVIGAFSPSGLSLDGPAHQYHRAVMAELTSGQHQRLGDAILAAQKTYAETGLMPELLTVYQLLGDPATKIR